MVEEDTRGRMNAVRLAIVPGQVEARDLADSVGRSRVESGSFALGRFFGIPEHLTGARKVKPARRAGIFKSREDVVRSVLRRSSFVVSDRLHALVLGHTEGALPIGLGTAGVDKIARTLATVGLVDVTGVQTELTVREAVGLLDGIDSRRSELLALVRPARARLAELSDRIAALGSARPSPRGREVRLGTGP